LKASSIYLLEAFFLLPTVEIAEMGE